MSDAPVETPLVKILLVEDSVADARFVRAALRSAPSRFQVVEANTLARAIEVLEGETFDAVLLDLALPDSLGLVTFALLHARFQLVPIIVMSALDDEKTAVSAVRLGAQDYLVKGKYDEDALWRSIRYAIERQKMLRQFVETLEWARRELASRASKPHAADDTPHHDRGICMWCRRILDGDRTWRPADEYLALLAEITCPDCEEQQRPA